MNARVPEIVGSDGADAGYGAARASRGDPCASNTLAIVLLASVTVVLLASVTVVLVARVVTSP